MVTIAAGALGSAAIAWPPQHGWWIEGALKSVLDELPLAAPPHVAILASTGLVLALALMCVWHARAWVAPDPERIMWVDATVLALALVLAAQAPLAQALWRALEPRMVAVGAYHRRRELPWEAQAAVRDPWGTPWCHRARHLIG